jgi:hypothetical protein
MLDAFAPSFESTALHAPLLELQDIFYAEEGNRRPIGVAMFGSSDVGLVLGEVLADCFHGAHRGHFVANIDLKDVLGKSIHAENKTVDFTAARQMLKAQIKRAVASCPERSLVVLKSAETLMGELVRLLDVLLDPLNHERPFLDGFDCSGVVVLLLMEGVTVLASSQWREALETQWKYDGTAPSQIHKRTNHLSW